MLKTTVAADVDAVQEGPLVSVVIHVQHDANRLGRLFERLEETSYRSFEVIVVSGESHTTIDRETSFPLSPSVEIVTNDGADSPAVARNLGAGRARGEFLLFLSDDLEPLNTGWLSHMVTSLQNATIVAVGPVLVRPGGEGNDQTALYAGIDIRGRGSAPVSQRLPVTDRTAPELRSEWLADTIDEAALLVRKSDFDEVGGFDTSYLFGLEDVDLCLRLSSRGRLVINANALCRHEKRSHLDDELGRVAAASNHQVFAEKWGARLTRTNFRRHLMEPEARRTVAFTLPPEDLDLREADHHAALRLAGAFEAQGWEVHLVPTGDEPSAQVPRKVDLFVSLVDNFDTRRVPDGAIKLAWIRKWVDKWMSRPWFGDFDVALSASHTAVDAVAKSSLVPVELIPPAIDVSMFTPGATSPVFHADYVLVANNTGKGRILHDVWDVRPGERALVFGKGWESAPRFARYWRGHLRYEHLPSVYRGAKIAVDDTPRSLKTYGFINDSALEALSSGTLVITDNENASSELFDGGLPVYRNTHEFRALLDRFIADEAARTELAASLRERVLANHDVITVPRRILRATEAVLYQPSVALKIAVPTEEVAPYWGDTHFANAMAAALQKQGFRARVDLLPAWDLPHRQEVDVAIHIRGRKTYVPKPAHINAIWIISHPDEVTPAECDAYDLVLVASREFAEHLAPLTSAPVHFLPQATDARRFVKGPRSQETSTDVLFVGNTRGAERPAVEWALQQGLALSVYGRGWQGLPDETFVGELIPNDELPSFYRSAGVVLNDHWPDMKEKGFVSNRVFDVLGSGGVVVSDPVAGLEELFGDLVPTYQTPTELRKIVENLLKDGSLREEIGNKGADLVREKHTFDRRAEQLIELLRPHLATYDMDLEGTKPRL